MFLSLFVLSPTDNDVMYGRNFSATVTIAENCSELSDIVVDQGLLYQTLSYFQIFMTFFYMKPTKTDQTLSHFTSDDHFRKRQPLVDDCIVLTDAFENGTSSNNE